MTTRVVRYRAAEGPRWGLHLGSCIRPLRSLPDSTAALVRAHAENGLTPLMLPDELDPQQLDLLSPVTRDQQFICQGANYRQHMIESGIDPDAKNFNMIFTKAASCISPPQGPVIRPPQVALLDYEIELGLVLRRDITAPIQVSEDRLQEFIAGIVIVNDYSARDVQLPQLQFYKGKSYRSFGPVGPVLQLLDSEEIAYLSRLQLELKVNGEVRQRDSTANMVFKPAPTLTELASMQDLHVGDLIATGTPAGCALSVPPPLVQRLSALLPESLKWRIFLGMQRRNPRYLQPGDVVEATIRSDDGRIDLGMQRNRVVEAPG